MGQLIVICTWCGGSGKRHQSECINGHTGETVEWDELCAWCGGHGRMVENVTVRKMTQVEIDLRKKPGETDD